MSTDTDALTERIARAFYENRVAAIVSDQERQSWPAWEDHEKADADEWRDAAAAVLPIVAEEVRKAKAEALREAAGDIVWSAETLPHMTPHDAARGLVRRADRIETGDGDERR